MRTGGRWRGGGGREGGTGDHTVALLTSLACRTSLEASFHVPSVHIVPQGGLSGPLQALGPSSPEP